MKNSVVRTVSNAVAAILLTLTAIPMPAWSDTPGRHPGYMHAISDLRSAKWLLERPDAHNVVQDEQNAVREIDACLHELTEAAWMDGKNVQDHPPTDEGLDHPGRLHKSLELLKKAHADMDKEEDDPTAQGFQARAIKHVDRAVGYTRRAIGDKFDDSFLR